MNLRYQSNFVRWLHQLLQGGTPDLTIDIAGGAVQKTKVYFSYYRFCAAERTRPETNHRLYSALKKAIPEILVKQRALVFPPLAAARDAFEQVIWI